MSFQLLLKIDSDPAFRIGVGRSFHQPGMWNENGEWLYKWLYRDIIAAGTMFNKMFNYI